MDGHYPCHHPLDADSRAMLHAMLDFVLQYGEEDSQRAAEFRDVLLLSSPKNQRRCAMKKVTLRDCLRAVREAAEYFESRTNETKGYMYRAIMSVRDVA